MNDEIVQICKQAAVVYFKLIQCLLSEYTEKQKWNCQIEDR